MRETTQRAVGKKNREDKISNDERNDFLRRTENKMELTGNEQRLTERLTERDGGGNISLPFFVKEERLAMNSSRRL